MNELGPELSRMIFNAYRVSMDNLLTIQHPEHWYFFSDIFIYYLYTQLAQMAGLHITRTATWCWRYRRHGGPLRWEFTLSEIIVIFFVVYLFYKKKQLFSIILFTVNAILLFCSNWLHVINYLLNLKQTLLICKLQISRRSSFLHIFVCILIVFFLCKIITC